MTALRSSDRADLAPFDARGQVLNAVSRQKKEEIVKELKGKLDDSMVVFGMRHKGLSVRPQDPSCSFVLRKFEKPCFYLLSLGRHRPEVQEGAARGCLRLRVQEQPDEGRYQGD